MISDLSPCDKLSLKGKIFELQKKLNIIDIQNKRHEEYSYKPKLYPNKYHLEDREPNIFENISKAEAIRKQRKEILQAVLVQQTEEVCTFSPIITKKSQKSIINDNRPVYERLTEKGKLYNDSMEEKRNKYKYFDESGKKLFTPLINEKDFKHCDQSTVISTAAADEFLYLDAVDKEERFRIRRREQQVEAEQLASSSKINKSSLMLLRQKAEKSARSLFLQIDANHTGSLGFDDIERTVKLIAPSEDVLKHGATAIAGSIWMILDPYNIGCVQYNNFVLITTSLFLHYKAPQAALKNVLASYSSIKNNIYKENPKCNIADSANEITIENISNFQIYLRKFTLLNEASSKKCIEAESISFNPHINRKSYKLALQKELKEKQEIGNLLSKSNVSISSFNEDSIFSSSDETDSIPPPPPPSELESKDNNSMGCTTLDQHAAVITNHDILYAKGKLFQMKHNEKVEKLKAEEMKACTFHPKIKSLPKFESLSLKKIKPNGIKNTTEEIFELQENKDVAISPSIRSVPSEEKIFERLYKEKNNLKRAVVVETSNQVIQEIKSCTFIPEMRNSFSHKKVGSIDKPINIPGFEKTINRYRETHKEKLKRLEDENAEKQREYQEQKYLKSRELARQGFAPFNFVLQDRDELKKQNQCKRLTEPDLIIDIKLSTTKTAKIPIWKGDDPMTIASSFALIYSLDETAQQLLMDVISQSMDQNGLIITTEEDLRNLSPASRLSRNSKYRSERTTSTVIKFDESNVDDNDYSEEEKEAYSEYSSDGNYSFDRSIQHNYDDDISKDDS